MARELTVLLSVLVVVAFSQHEAFLVAGEPQVPCYFIFGDSLVDSGNNNELETKAKANYEPYGIDFPKGVTGRFTNGRTMADIIGELLGFPNFIPPFATVSDEEINTGVNYGSGSAGIREESGSHLGDRISLDRQLLNHETTISRLSVLQNNKTFTDEYLQKCIYLSNIGSNDYINNYLIPNTYTTSNTYTTDQYAAVLVQQYSQQLKVYYHADIRLYNLGARKIVVFGLGLIGCAPAEIARFGTDGKPCVESINDAVKLFNDNLKDLVDELNKDNSDATFTFINLASISAPQGDVEIVPNVPCCQVREDGQCVDNSSPCPIRAMSVFYDGFHPSEIANTLVATRSFLAISPKDASPYDIKCPSMCYSPCKNLSGASRPTSMARELSFLLPILIVVAFSQCQAFLFAGKQQVPCYFIFGDSLVDSGNNNELTTQAKANYNPYGIDFPEGVSGRFTNGRTMADIIGQLLGFSHFIPPYATVSDEEISTGVNYGSGSAVSFIHSNRTRLGENENLRACIYADNVPFGDRISLDRQLLNHETTISRLSVLQSNNTFTHEYLQKCIYLSNIGSNDYINNYLIPNIYSTSNVYTSDQYAAVLVQQYSQQLMTLYNLGARKIVVFGLAKIGCAPAEIARFGTNGKLCVESINDAVKLFNDRLKALVYKLNKDNSDARFTFINLARISAPQGDLAILPNVACCPLRTDGQCADNSCPCQIRALSIFYDGFHSSDIANTIVAARSYIALSPNDASPYDISHLARL
ncbi:hypothetical protein OSB04_008463 [Centaurea solstitialis]|uniref:GDSL esterase/lipase n=1 Tax=Centaurea solstitialis TaxID=347529 RepID=A0AA38U6C7_9ASTR|nr:hypothetical protein OSB04_008463 [Centaurea solstitialis]